MASNARFDLQGGVIVSCQAPLGSPMRDPHAMALMAMAAEQAGAIGIRAEGSMDIVAIAEVVAVPIIGIRKLRRSGSEIHITSTTEDVDLVADAGAQIVALDGSSRMRPFEQALEQVISHARTRGLSVMADLNFATDAERAVAGGVDYLGTTLIRPSPADIEPGGPNIAVIAELTAKFPMVPVIAEGRYSTVEHVRRAFEAGAYAVVIGTAITDTLALARRFVAATPRFSVTEKMRSTAQTDGH